MTFVVSFILTVMRHSKVSKIMEQIQEIATVIREDIVVRLLRRPST